MPVKGDKKAPKTFSGKYTEVQTFLDHYERLLRKYRVSIDKEKCRMIMKYCTVDVQNVIRTLNGYAQKQWEQLKQEILRVFDAERVLQKYKPADVEHYAAKHRTRTCDNLTQWREYHRKFNKIAGGPLSKKHLSREDYNAYFWIGVNKPLRQVLESRILQLNPYRSHKAQYTVREIDQAAEWHFRRDKYESLMVRAADLGEEQDDWSGEDSDSDSGSDDSESDYEEYKRKRKNRREKKKKESKKKKRTKKPTTEPETQKYAGNEDEIAKLITKLSKMNLEDPDYAPIYYKVMVMDHKGIAEKCVRPPVDKPSPIKRPPSRTFSRPEPKTSNPATYPNNIPLGSPNAANEGQQNPSCFGCNEPGHRISECRQVTSLLARGIAKHDEATGRLVMASGNRIRRLAGESLVKAAERMASETAPRVMLGYVDLTPNRWNAVQSFYHARQHAHIEEVTSNHPREKVADKAAKRPAFEHGTRPVDARKVRIVDESDVDMRDVQHSNKKTPHKADEHPAKNEQIPKSAGRQSELAGTVDPKQVMERILDTEIKMSLREIMVTAKELRTEFQDLIKVKNVKAVLLGGTRGGFAVDNIGWPRSDGILIQIDLKTAEGRDINAIIDTGSQLDVVRQDVAATIIRKPVDMSQVTNMNDANGGKGQLQGWIKDVEFTCGDAATVTDLWVAQRAPFTLLLGRPWQRGNLVSID
ncbi:hypothetical protein R3P38DRAFT_2412574, partial [Favolaschia claudopus]